MKFILGIFIFVTIIINGQEWNRVYSYLPNNNGVSSLYSTDTSLLISGGFTQINTTPINYITSFNGNTCNPIGDGIIGQSYSYAIYQDKLYLGGDFNSAGGNSNFDKLAKWDGSSWLGFGNEVNRTIEALAQYKGDLYGVGTIPDIFGVQNLNGIFRHDGTNFYSVNGGLNGGPLSVTSCVVYDSLLLVGGYIYSADNIVVNNLPAWDGTQWGAYAGGTNDYIQYMFVDSINGYLYISGNFTVVGGGGPVSYFARWDGQTWTSVDNGVDCNVLDMALYQNQLYIAGCFQQAGNKPIKAIARYNGVEWDSLGTCYSNNGAEAIEVFQGDLYVGGTFSSIGDTITHGLAKWTYPLDSACKEMYAGIGVHPDTLYTSELPYTFRSGCYGNGSLQWEFSDGYIANKGHTAYDFNSTPGIYNIMLTAQCGLNADTVYSQVVIVSDVGIKENELANVLIYPNPSDGKFSINSKEFVGKMVRVKVYDLQGKLVLSKQIYFSTETVNLDLNLSKGNYQLEFTTGQKKGVRQLVVE